MRIVQQVCSQGEELTDLRNEVADEMVDEILECSLKDFLCHYAPWQVPVTIVNNVYKFYVGGNECRSPLVKRIEQGHETTLPEGFVFDHSEPEPAKHGSGPDVFKGLNEIVDSLHQQKFQGVLFEGSKRTPTLCYEDFPCKNPTSEIEGTDIRMDAYLTVEKSKDTDYRDPSLDRVDLADVAVAVEFKRNVRHRSQNRCQLIADVSQVLNNDPRRTWMYALTIENTMMSIWYFSRSHTVVSVPFDFTTEIKSFIHVFLCLIYATREEVGYDPTIHRVLLDDKIRYVYEIESEGRKRYFRTMETLFASRAPCITGRKTRVWKAVEVEGYEDGMYVKEKEGGREVALKDYWLDEGSRTERAILSDIFERLDKAKHDSTILDWADPPIKKSFRDLLVTGDYKQYFMGIEADMMLSATKLRLSSAKPVPEFLVPSQNVESSSKNTTSKSTQTTQSIVAMANARHKAGQNMPEVPIPREYRAKRHYRLIYEEVGEPLYAATNLRSTFYALADVLTALTLLYLAGYVHRDVSTGNIIMVEGPNKVTRGKLSDLEYAKVFQDKKPSPDPKTGTLFFMAYEIHAGNVLYNEPLELDSCEDPRSITKVSPTSSEMPGRPKFRFTHDIESLLWVALYFPVKYLPRGTTGRNLFDAIYVTAYEPSFVRGHLIRNGMAKFQSYLQEHLDPEVSFFPEHLALYQSALRWSYMKQENFDNMFDHKRYGRVYNFAHEAFSRIKAVFESDSALNFDFSSGMDVQQRSLQPETQRKRPRTEKVRDNDDYTPGERETEPEDQPARKQPKKGKTMDSRQLHAV